VTERVPLSDDDDEAVASASKKGKRRATGRGSEETGKIVLISSILTY
jgi:hypothetical protein